MGNAQFRKGGLSGAKFDNSKGKANGLLNDATQKAPGLKPLAYRLREGVSLHKKEGSLVLVLSYPLKAIVLNRVWEKVFRLISRGVFISFEDVLSLLDSVDPARAVLFLDDLVRKGFLDREGVLSPQNDPLVSIIVPVRNRPAEIKACLHSLEGLQYPKERLEVMVVDDASTDHTPEIVSTFPVTLIKLAEHKHASFCRNLAAQKATGEILAFIDSDCLADPFWLRELVAAFMDPSLGAVGGMVESYFSKKGLDQYEKVKSSLIVGHWFQRSQEKESFFYIPSCNLLVRRDLFLELGGFREALSVGEDVDLCWRLQESGSFCEYRPMGRVYHRHRNRIKAFCKRRFDYGTSEPLLLQLHPNREKRMLFPPVASLFWLVLALSLFVGSFVPASLCGIVFLTDCFHRYIRVGPKRNMPIGLLRIIPAVLRSYLAFLYHCCAFLSRYYLFWSPIMFLLFPPASMIVIGAHIVTGFVEYQIKKPSLNPLSFLFFFSLDQLFYQWGVWYRCIKNHYFKPINPRVTIMTDFEEA
jgi:mycofactocin system glycosyltransferase